MKSPSLACTLAGFKEEPVGKLRKISDERDARRCLAAAEAAGGEA
jgi:hypothetical protein